MADQKLISVLTICTLVCFFITIFRSNNPRSYLLVVIYLFPFMSFPVTKESMGGFKVFDLLAFFSFFYFLRYFFAKGSFDKKHLYLLLFSALAVIGFLGGFNSEFKSNALLNLVKIFPAFIFARFMLLNLQDPQFFDKIAKAIRLTLIVALSFFLLQLIIGLKFTFYPSLNPNTADATRNILRYPGYFYDSQAAGQFFAMGSFLMLYCLSVSRNNATKLLELVLFAGCCAAMLLAGSRSAYFGFFVGVLLLVIMSVKRQPVILLLSVALGVFIYIFVPGDSGALSRFKDFNGDLQFRESLWKEAFEISKENALLGIGSGNYQPYVKAHYPNQYLELNGEIVYFDQPENGYLNILVEFGFIGFTIIIIMLTTPLLSAIKKYFFNEIDFKILFIAAALASWLVAFYSVYSIFDNRILLFVVTIVSLLVTYPKNKAVCEHS